jgi:hypothetical protein
VPGKHSSNRGYMQILTATFEPILAAGVLLGASGPLIAEEEACRLPQVQNEFVSFVVNGREEHYRTNYANREYALNLEGLVLSDRAGEAIFLMPNGDFSDWYAVLRKTVEQDDAGQDVIQASLEVGPYISFRLQFHNEIFGESYDTRIAVDTTLGQQLSTMLEGSEVVVSGRFIRVDDKLLELSFTPANAVTHPAYLVELGAIRQVVSESDCMDVLEIIEPD